jgi:hypothetical protein
MTEEAVKSGIYEKNILNDLIKSYNRYENYLT